MSRTKTPLDKKASKTSLPPHQPVKPMLATLVDEPFDKDGWLFEIKWDGYRAIAEVEDGQVLLYSRTGKPFGQYPPILAALAKLDRKAILDGEIVVLDHAGRSSFQLLQNYQKTGRGSLVYFVFDILALDDMDLRSRPLGERKKLLKGLLKGLSAVRGSEHVERDGKAFYAAAGAHGLEGVIAKRALSTYQEGRRSQDWLKIKVRQRQEAVIGGFTEPRGQRRDLGALVLGVYDKGELVYIGHTGTGFSDRTLKELREQLQPLIRSTCPFAKRPATNAPVQWVEPRRVAEVEFQEWSNDGHMRQPVFLGLRDDKPPRSVHREKPKHSPAQIEGDVLDLA